MRRLIIPAAIIATVSGCAAQPSQPRAFDLFFESNKASLTPDARGIVEQAASTVQSEQPSRIVVLGMATGSTANDARLAAKRANAVVDALVAAHVDPSKIDRQTMLVEPSTPTITDRVAAHKVQIELVPDTMTAQEPARSSPQWVGSGPTRASSLTTQQAAR